MNLFGQLGPPRIRDLIQKICAERDTQRPLLEALLEAALAEGGAGEEPIAVRAGTRTRDLDPWDGSGDKCSAFA